MCSAVRPGWSLLPGGGSHLRALPLQLAFWTRECRAEPGDSVLILESPFGPVLSIQCDFQEASEMMCELAGPGIWTASVTLHVTQLCPFQRSQDE